MRISGRDIPIVNELYVCEEINGERRLTFSIPITSPYMSLVEGFAPVEFEGQLYNIVSIDEKWPFAVVNALHVYTDLSYKHIPMFPSVKAFDTVQPNSDYECLVNTDAQVVFELCLDGTPFYSVPDNKANALGLNKIRDSIDYWTVGKTTPMEVIRGLIDQLGKGELYIDNYSLALVDRIGKDTSIELRTDRDLSSLRKMRDYSNVITRLYGYGEGDLVSDKVYVDSGIEYPGVIREGYFDFTDISADLDNANDRLEAKMLERMNMTNNNPAEPKVSYEIDMIDLHKIGLLPRDILLGDTVRITDSRMGVSEEVRVIKKEWYPYDPKRGKVTLGNKIKTVKDMLIGGMMNV